MTSLLVLPLKDITAKEIRSLTGAERLREFNTAPTTGFSRIRQRKTWPYGGKFKTYPKFINDAFIESWIKINTDGNTAVGKTKGKEFSLRAPRGYKFGSDNNGAKLFKIKDSSIDLHLDSSNVFQPVSSLRRGLLQNQAKRAEIQARQKQDKKNKEIFFKNIGNTVVFIDDSRRAGNCGQGIKAFALRNKLNAEIGISATKLMKLAKKETMISDRIINSIYKAFERETMVSI